MGLRLYNPSTGKFLSVDSVFGGTGNAYQYPADPINLSDSSGQGSVKDKRFSKQCAAAGCFYGRSVCYFGFDDGSRCRVNVEWRLKGKFKYSEGVLWAYQIYINYDYQKSGEYSHPENGNYLWHTNWGGQTKAHGTGYWVQHGFFGNEGHHLHVGGVFEIDAEGSGYGDDGAENYYGYAIWHI